MSEWRNDSILIDLNGKTLLTGRVMIASLTERADKHPYVSLRVKEFKESIRMDDALGEVIAVYHKPSLKDRLKGWKASTKTARKNRSAVIDFAKREV